MTLTDHPATAALRLELADYPVLFQAADGRAILAQRSYRRLVAIELASLVMGSLLGAAVGWVAASARVAGVVSAITFLIAILARIVRERRGDDRLWFDARAVAETAKTQTWRYAMRVPPFDDDPTADRRFVRELGAVLHARSDLVLTNDAANGATNQISAKMRAIRAMPLLERRDVYVESRLRDQADWYRRSAIRHGRLGQRWSWGSLAAEGLAVIAAVLALQLPGLGDLGFLGILGAVAAAFTAWGQAGRHGELAKSYGLAYQELLLITGFAESARQESDLHELVRDAEAAISREHTMWIAKRSDRDLERRTAPSYANGSEETLS